VTTETWVPAASRQASISALTSPALPGPTATAKELDLLLLPGSAGMEVLPEGFVLDLVPADSDTEAQSTAGQEINIGRLACHERCLALRKDQDSGGELDSLGDTGQIGEHHKRVVERVVLGVGARDRRRPIGVNGTEHVVVSEKVVKAQVLDRSPDLPNSARISSKLVLRVDDANLHGLQSAGLAPVGGARLNGVVDQARLSMANEWS
jgi:hypothetical protein